MSQQNQQQDPRPTPQQQQQQEDTDSGDSEDDSGSGSSSSGSEESASIDSQEKEYNALYNYMHRQFTGVGYTHISPAAMHTLVAFAATSAKNITNEALRQMDLAEFHQNFDRDTYIRNVVANDQVAVDNAVHWIPKYEQHIKNELAKKKK